MSDCERLLGPAAPMTRRLAGNLVPAPRPWRAAGPLGAHRLWLVALSAVLEARAHGSSLGTLYPSPWLDRYGSAAALEPDWGITSRDALLSKLEWLSATGTRASMAARLGHPSMAWDFARYSWVVRYGFAAEYIDEAEAWHLLEPVAGQVAGCYGSWREYADDYLAARLAWRGDTDEPGAYGASQQRTIAAVSALLNPASTRSPWNLVPWDAISRPDQPVTASQPPSGGRNAPDRSG
jgi:hypothetical protein